MKNLVVWFHWIPRILCILAILFCQYVCTGCFSPGLRWWEQIRDFLIHLIPSYILLLFLWVAWIKEKLGGILFIVIGTITTPRYFFSTTTGLVLFGSELASFFLSQCLLLWLEQYSLSATI